MTLASDFTNSATSLTNTINTYRGNPTSENAASMVLAAEGLVVSGLAFFKSVPDLELLTPVLGTETLLAAVEVDAINFIQTINSQRSTVSDIVNATASLIADSTAAASGFATAVTLVNPAIGVIFTPAAAALGGVSLLTNAAQLAYNISHLAYTPVYDASGYDQKGFDSQGYNVFGRDLNNNLDPRLENAPQAKTETYTDGSSISVQIAKDGSAFSVLTQPNGTKTSTEIDSLGRTTSVLSVTPSGQANYTTFNPSTGAITGNLQENGVTIYNTTLAPDAQGSVEFTITNYNAGTGTVADESASSLPSTGGSGSSAYAGPGGQGGTSNNLTVTPPQGPSTTFPLGTTSSSGGTNNATLPTIAPDSSGGLQASVPANGTTPSYTVTLANEADGTHLVLALGNTIINLSPTDQQALESGIDYGGDIGSYVGGQLALLLASNSALANLATSTTFSTVGEILGQEIAAQNLQGADLSSTVIENDFATNAGEGIGGFLGGEAGSALFTALGINPTAGELLGTTFGTAAAAYAIANVDSVLGVTTMLSTDFLKDLASGLPSLGVSAFEDLTGLNPSDLDLFGGSTQDAQIGASIGGLLGTVLLPEFPVLNTVLGQLIGSIIGSIFGEPSVGPNASDDIGLNIQGGVFYISNRNSDNNASQDMINLINNLSNSVVAFLNGEVEAIGGTVSGASGLESLRVFQGAFYDAMDGYANFPNPNSVDFNQDYNSLLNDAVIRQLAVTSISGGNTMLVQTIQNSLKSYDIYYNFRVYSQSPMEETIDQLNYDLQAVSDYAAYQQNKVAFLVGYALRDPTNATADWDAEFARAALLQRVNIYNPYQYNQTYNYYGNTNIGNEGLLLLDSSISVSDVSISRSGSDLVLSIAINGSTNKVTIQGAFANLDNTLGELEFTAGTGVPLSQLLLSDPSALEAADTDPFNNLTGPTTWTGVDMEALLPSGFTGSVSLSSVVRFDTANATQTSITSNAPVLMHAMSDTLTLNGSGNIIAVTGLDDALTVNGTSNFIHFGNQQTGTINGGFQTIDIEGVETTVSLGGDNDVVTINGNDITLGLNGANTNILANGQNNNLTVSGNNGTVIAQGGSVTLNISGSNELIDAYGTTDLVTLNVSGQSTLNMGYGSASLANGTAVTINGTIDNVSLVDNDYVIVTGGSMSVTMTGDYDNLLVEGDDETLNVGANAASDYLEEDGTHSSLDLAGGGDTLVIKGIYDALVVSGSNNNLTIDGAVGNTATLSNYNNTLATAATTITFLDSSGGTINGGGNTITLGSSDVVFLTGDGQSFDVNGSYSTATLMGSYVTAVIGGTGNHIVFNGQNETIALSGQANFVQELGPNSQVTVSGTGQDVQISGGVVTIAAGAQAVFDGTNHGGNTDFGNGNIFNVGSGASLIITGSNNWVQASSNDSITFEDQGDGVGATGGGNIISFQATGDYADISNSTLNVAAGLQAQLTGSGNYISANSGASVTITGSNNIGVSNGSGGIFSIAGTGNAFYINGGTVDLTNTAPAPGYTSPIKGFAFDSYSNGEFETPASAASLQALSATGANSVEMVVTQYTPSLTDPTIAATSQTESDASLEQAIREAQSDGLSVLLKPQIDPSTGEYRALYNFSDPSQFFANYKTFIVHYAEIAQAMGVGMFSIGSELTSLTGPAYASQWDDIIASVRQVYSGKLTYASAYNETASVSFWGSLDVIGANPYEALTTIPNPTLAQLEAGWTTTPEADLDNLSPVAFYSDLSAAYQKPVLFTEVGYRSVDESNLLQGSNSATAPDGSYLYPDFQQQSTALQAFFDVYNQYGGSWLDGAYVWEWNPNSANVTPTDFSVQNKPALNVVESGFDPTTAMASYGEANVTGYGNTVTLSAGDTVNLSGGSGNVTSQSGDRVAISNTYGNSDTINATNDLSNVTAADGLIAGIYVASNTEANVMGSNNSLSLGTDDSVHVSGGGNTINTQAGNLVAISSTGTNADVVVGSNDQSGAYTEVYQGTGISLSAHSDLALNGSNDAVTGSGNNRVIVNGSNNVLNVGSGSYIEVQTGAQNVIFANGDNIVFDVQGSNAVIVGSNNKITGSYDYFGEYGNNNVTLGNFDAVNGSSSSDFTVGSNNSDYGSETSKSSFSGGSGGYYGYYGLTASKKSSSASGIDVVAQYDATQGYTQAAAAAQAAMEQTEQAAAGAFATSSDTLSQQPSTAFWTEPTITWSFAPGPGTGASPFSAAIGAQEQPIIEEAIDTWEAASGLTFQQVSADAPADISIGWGDFDTADSGVLGYTTASHSGNSVLSGAVLRLEDPSETALTVDANGQFVYGDTDVTLYQSALHEIGHALGLADNSDPNSVMYATLGPNNTTLDATDIAAIQSLYGPEGTAAAFFSETPLLTVPQATQAALALSAAQSSLLPPTVLH